MTQQVPDVSESDVERIVLREFSETDATKATALIRASYYAHRPRTVLACLKLSAGSLEMLEQNLKDDWRDLISAAEYPSASAIPWPRPEQLAASELQRIYDSDWQQYAEWLSQPDSEAAGKPTQVKVYLNPLFMLLAEAERQKRKPLTQQEVIGIRDSAAHIMMTPEQAKAFYQSLYVQISVPWINPDRAWEEWQEIRTNMK